MRGLTIAASILIALVLQLDAVEIFHFVSTNAAARNALVASADKVIQDADTASDGKGGLIKRIADAWIARTEEGPLQIDLRAVSNTDQLRDMLAARPNFNSQDFDLILAKATRAHYDEQRNKLADLTRSVSATGFEFIPIAYWRWPGDGGVRASLWNVVPHLPGIGLCAALLTLGAPYWFNVLKNLASLRPALARAISQEETEAKQ